ncbi:MAG: hypothetical protein ACXQTW_00925 [Candidatus Methanospirareceae archaeon]
MVALKINLRRILSLLLITAFCLTPLCMSVCVAGEQTSLPATPFMHVEIKDLRYDHVYGTEMVKNGSEVSIKIVLTNINKEIKNSTLGFHSELVDASGHLSVDERAAEVLESGSSYRLNHEKVMDKVVISWTGEAPEVRKREEFTLLNLTEETREGVYSVIEIRRDVSSEAIEDALSMWHEANETIAKASLAIAEAEEGGINVGEAKKSLELANEHLNNSRQYYNEGRPEDALVEAEKALDSAKDAEAKVGSAVGGRTFRNYAIISVVVVITIIALVLLLQHRRRKRRIY